MTQRVLTGLASLFLALGVMAAPVMAQNGGDQIINVRDADIKDFIADVSSVTGYDLIVHPQVRGTVTVTSQRPLNADEVFELFQATMRVNGFAVLESGDRTYRIVPEELAAGDSGARINARSDENEFATSVFHLNNVRAVSAANAIEPILSPQGEVTANEDTNALIVVDYAGNIARIRQVIAQIDQQNLETATIPIKNMGAQEMVETLREILGGGDGRNERLAGGIRLTAVRSGNTLVIRGDGAEVARLRGLVAELDQESLRRDSIRVIRLEHAKAEELVPVLEQVAAAAAPAEGAPAPGGGPRISFDRGTNALVISAAPETLREMERVIAELDIRRAQVQVEAIIVEVSDSLAKELGLQFLLTGDGDDSVPFATTTYSQSAPNVLALAGALITDSFSQTDENGNTTFSGTNPLRDAALNSLLGVQGLTLGVGGQNNDGLIFGAVLNAVNNDQDSNVLSMPFGMMLDNEEVALNVGQEIPVSTGEVLSQANNNPFRTIDRKEVGVKLRVTPQIGEGDTIRLSIYQEVSSVIGPVNVVSGELITSLRTISTIVNADNGEVIVLGGLIQDDEQVQTSKVPLLGDIPGVGRAFRSEGSSRQRTNLMVFIRPTIVRNAADARAVTDQKYGYIRNEQLLASDGESIKLDEIVSAAMGESPAQ